MLSFFPPGTANLRPLSTPHWTFPEWCKLTDARIEGLSLEEETPEQSEFRRCEMFSVEGLAKSPDYKRILEIWHSFDDFLMTLPPPVLG
jgi:hypothetical protein